MKYKASIDKKVDRAVIEDLFAINVGEFRRNLPLRQMGIPDNDRIIKDYVIESFERCAAQEDGVVIRTIDTETDRVMCYYTAHVDRIMGLLTFKVVLYNTDEKGSKSWLYDYYKSPAIFPVLESLGLDDWTVTTYRGAPAIRHLEKAKVEGSHVEVHSPPQRKGRLGI